MSTYDRDTPGEGAEALSADIRAKIQALDSSVLGVNLLGDPTFKCWPYGSPVVAGNVTGHWNCSGGSGAEVQLLQDANGFLEHQDASARTYARLVHGTSATRMYQTLLSSAAFLDMYQGIPFSIACALKQSAGSQGQVFLYDGNSYQYSTTFAGTGSWQWVSVSKTTHATLSDQLVFGIESNAAGNLDIDACVCMIGSVPPQVFIPARSVIAPVCFYWLGACAADATNPKWQYDWMRPTVIRSLRAGCDQLGASGNTTVDLRQVTVAAWPPTMSTMFSAAKDLTTAQYVNEWEPDGGTYAARCFQGLHGTTPNYSRMAVLVTAVGGTPAEGLKLNVYAEQWPRPLDSFELFSSVG